MKVRYLLLAGFVGCTFGVPVDTCPGVCWSYTQTIEDDGTDGIFDLQCKDGNGNNLPVDIPASGDMSGKTCVTNPVHLAMRSVIRDVNHNGDFVDSTMQEQTNYVTATNAISTDLGTECRAYLLNEGCALGCDEPMCSQQEEDAWNAWNAICNQFLVTPSQTAMHDSTGCMGWDPPVESTIDNIEVSDPDECFALDTGGGDDLGDPPIMCDGDGEAGEQADETGEELGFGNLAMLIDCDPATTCEIGDQLLYNVQANFEIFHAEGVLLTMVSLSGGTSGGTIVGAQVTGLDSGEDSYDLLWTHLGMRNNDVITHVNTVALNSSGNVLEVLEDLLTTATWDVTVRRPRSGGWDTREYFIHLPFTSP